MAKVVITIKDPPQEPVGDTIDITVECDPELPMVEGELDGRRATNAQMAGVLAVRYLTEDALKVVGFQIEGSQVAAEGGTMRARFEEDTEEQTNGDSAPDA